MGLFLGMVFTWLVILLGIGLAVVGIRALLRRQGPWRWTAVPSLLLVIGVVLNIVLDVRADPTSHNLWPFEVLAAIIVGIGILGILELLRMGLTWGSRGGNA
jgi:hypothetical protein